MQQAMKAKTIQIEDLFTHKPWLPRPTFLAQPKIYGVRGIWDPVKRQLFTRQGKVITSLPHIEIDIRTNRLSNYMLDGELFSDSLCFEELQGIIRTGLNKPKNAFLNRLCSDKVNSIKYHLFDLIDDNSAAFERSDFILHNCEESENIIKVPTLLIKDEEAALDFYKKCIRLGYEGAVFRNVTLKYGEKGGLFRMKPTRSMMCKLVGFKSNDVIRLEANGVQFDCCGMNERTRAIIHKLYAGADIPILHDGFTKFGIPCFGRIDNEKIYMS